MLCCCFFRRGRGMFDVCVSSCVCAWMWVCVRDTFAFGDRFTGQRECLCFCLNLWLCVLANYCTCVLFLVILFTFSREVNSPSLQCVFSCLTDLFLRRLLLLNITHLDAQYVPLLLIPCLPWPHYHANNSTNRTALSPRWVFIRGATRHIPDYFIYHTVSLMLQELKIWKWED